MFGLAGLLNELFGRHKELKKSSVQKLLYAYSLLGIAQATRTEDIERDFQATFAAAAMAAEVNEAYLILSEVESRKKYDAARAEGFDHLHAAAYARGLNTEPPPAPHRGDVHTALDVPHSRIGGSVLIKAQRLEKCGACRGNGALSEDASRCQACGGSGISSGAALMEEFLGESGGSRVCQSCRGFGRIFVAPCSACSGSGLIYVIRTIRVDIPTRSVRSHSRWPRRRSSRSRFRSSRYSDSARRSR